MVNMPISYVTELNLAQAVTRSGCLEVAKFQLSQSTLALISNTMDASARSGKQKLSRWTYNNGGEGCHALDIDERQLTAVQINTAAGKGGLEMLRWLQINCLTMMCMISAIDAAVANGHKRLSSLMTGTTLAEVCRLS